MSSLLLPAAFTAATLLGLISASPAHAACADATVTISAPSLATSNRNSFENRFRRSLARACEWWGPTFEGPYTIDMQDNRGPSMALVPAWRGQQGHMLFRGPIVSESRSAITHEVIHVLAPNANRFLAEGLGVYAHHLLDGQAAYPNFGKDLNREARKLLDRADVAALDRIATPTRLQLSNLNGQNSYIVAGSFVGYLIQRHGMEKFRQLYALTPLVTGQRDAGNPERWQQVYNVSLGELVNEWRSKIAS